MQSTTVNCVQMQKLIIFTLSGSSVRATYEALYSLYVDRSIDWVRTAQRRVTWSRHISSVWMRSVCRDENRRDGWSVHLLQSGNTGDISDDLVWNSWCDQEKRRPTERRHHLRPRLRVQLFRFQGTCSNAFVSILSAIIVIVWTDNVCVRTRCA